MQISVYKYRYRVLLVNTYIKLVNTLIKYEFLLVNSLSLNVNICLGSRFLLNAYTGLLAVFN